MNPVIGMVREGWDAHDAHAHASEALFQLARLWTEHHSPATGTFPLAWRDTPSGVLTYADALQTGEDALYWDLVAALLDEQGLLHVPAGEVNMEPLLDRWRAGDVPPGYDPDRAMRHIMVATHALARLHRMTDG